MHSNRAEEPCSASAQTTSAQFDVVLRHGRVMDPETGRDEVTDVGIRDGRIEKIGTDIGQGRLEVDASGLVVAPGFVDIHSHGHCIAADRMQAFDGVTTTLELEIGALNVANWYESQANAGRVLNYGVGVAWALAHKAVLADMELEALAPLEALASMPEDTRWSQGTANDAQVETIMGMVEQGLNAGAIGIGIPNAYVPGAGMKELTRLCQLAAQTQTPTFSHVAYMSNIDPQSSIEAYIRLIGLAGATGAHMHVCHLNSTSGLDIEQSATILRKAQAQGLPITVEAYPYGTSSTIVSAAFFSDPLYPQRSGRDYAAVQLVANGHRFQDREDLMRARSENPSQLILNYFLDVDDDGPHQRLLDISVTYPGGAIASDAMPWITPEGQTYEGDEWPLPANLVSHPRSSSTFTHFLSEYVRRRKLVPLMQALEKCSLIPIKIVEKRVPALAKKGRIQEGCDADIIVFDPETVTDKATFEHMNQAALGMQYVLVNGAFVIYQGQLETAARPGKPVRAKVAA